MIQDTSAAACKANCSYFTYLRLTAPKRSLTQSFDCDAFSDHVPICFIHCSDHLRRIRTSQTGRSLVDITGDSQIYVYLHKYFVFLVKAGGQRVVECVLEDPPRVMASPQRSLSLSQSQDGSMDEEDKYEKALTTVDFQVISGR